MAKARSERARVTMIKSRTGSDPVDPDSAPITRIRHWQGVDSDPIEIDLGPFGGSKNPSREDFASQAGPDRSCIVTFRVPNLGVEDSNGEDQDPDPEIQGPDPEIQDPNPEIQDPNCGAQNPIVTDSALRPERQVSPLDPDDRWIIEAIALVHETIENVQTFLQHVTNEFYNNLEDKLARHDWEIENLKIEKVKVRAAVENVGAAVAHTHWEAGELAASLARARHDIATHWVIMVQTHQYDQDSC
ncbi:hypothetical protein EJ06DRAFT_569245 [Trichodelitschia bisporula]|uniref:Uncharacterized protein n=1 Tax=Trichodelitschia bisporula TaxID=703511 RepID=A0A6G1HKT2_9PEZI|nr:hypothetical protein EJ06DRAFT_569245 [Trichodelitschia bisporula]